MEVLIVVYQKKKENKREHNQSNKYIQQSTYRAMKTIPGTHKIKFGFSYWNWQTDTTRKKDIANNRYIQK